MLVKNGGFATSKLSKNGGLLSEKDVTDKNMTEFP